MQHERVEPRFLGPTAAAPYRFAIVASRFHESAVARLLDAAVDCLKRHGAAGERVRIVRVPGSWEIPVVVRRLANARSADAIVGLGVLIRGETAHFDLIARQVSRGMAVASEATGIPVIFGVVAADSAEQVQDRSGGRLGNRGWDAAVAAIETAAAIRGIGGPGAGGSGS